ncbi:MAG: hypothetical protein M3Z75_20985 [Actinomycetota bacterium]|nr:hypothetical protein [Actinomycetota bacterium]
MNYGQPGAVCPQCGSAAAVHSIEELATLAKNQLAPQPGYGPSPQPGSAQQDYGPPAQDYGPSGFDPPPPGGYGAPSESGYAAPPPPGYQGPPPPGYTGSARPGGSVQGASAPISDPGAGVEDLIADVVMGAATKFFGRAISRRVQRAVNERVLPSLAARKDAMLRDQITVAERHPDLRACLTDQVVFLDGGQRVLPLPNLSAGFTVEQSDALVARLRDG